MRIKEIKVNETNYIIQMIIIINVNQYQHGHVQQQQEEKRKKKNKWLIWIIQYRMKVQILVITVLTVIGQCLKVKDFEPNLFKFNSIEEGFRVIDTGSDTIGEVMAFTDLNGDRYTDYVALESRNASQLLLYVWDQKNEVFTLYKRMFPETFTVTTIQEIIVYDLNQDGNNQFIITTTNHKLYNTYIFITNCILCEDNLTLLVNSQIDSQSSLPFLLDNQGNGVVRLMTFNATGRFLYLYDFISNTYNVNKFSSLLDTNQKSFNPVDKHFASIIDLNNDCFADLAILSYKEVDEHKLYQIELYEKQKNNNYSLKNTVSLQNAGDFSNLQQIIDQILMLTWTDIDNSGAIDLVFFYKSNSKLYLKTLINDFTPSQVCQQSSKGLFPYQDLNLISLPSLSISSSYTLSSVSIPRFNDLNADGLPDILTIMEINGYSKVTILINQGNLYFSKYEDQWKAYDLNNPSQAIFFDFGEDGKMDMMVLSQQKKTLNNITTTSFTRTSIINNLQSDTLHLKIIPLSISSIYDEQQKKVENTFGVTTQWLFTDIDGQKHVKTSNQKYQFNYGTLQLPYAYSGLGRTNNYLEELTVGYQNYGQRNDWTPIIPNSQLMVYKQQGDWKLETLLRNDERVNDVIYVSIMILLCMGTVIIYLGYREAQEDKRDHYNFIQLIR